MKATIVLIAIGVALLIDEKGYHEIATVIVLVAFWEALGEKLWADLVSWWDRAWLDGARMLYGDHIAKLSPRIMGTKELAGYLVLISTGILVLGTIWWIVGTQAFVGKLLSIAAWWFEEAAEIADFFGATRMADIFRELSSIVIDLR